MALVKVKEKYQVTLPAEIRKKAEVAVGDLLEATVEGKKITLAPKAMLDRELAQAVKEVKEGKTYGPFNSAKSLVRSLHREVRKLKKKSA
ncbi:MAG TPA: AbrB/MazE/SpoVT family DNA-binding domain-containing protein [Candidatus Binatia bacterium]